MKTKLTLLTILILIGSCSSDRKCRRYAKLPCFTKSDSVRVDSFERIVRERDTTKVVEIVREYIKDSSKADSNDIVTIRKYRFKGFVGTLIIDWSKHTYDLNGVVLSENKKETIKTVDSASSKKNQSEKKTIEVKPDCPKQKWWDTIEIGMLLINLIYLAIALIIRQILKSLGSKPDNNTF